MVHASITRLTTQLGELEASQSYKPSTLNLVNYTLIKLNLLNAEFKTHHYGLINVIQDEETLTKEQDILDKHDDHVADLTARIKLLKASCNASSSSRARQITSCRLSDIQKRVLEVDTAVSQLTTDVEPHLVHQYQEQFTDNKAELADVHLSILSLGLEQGNVMENIISNLEKKLFSCGLQIKKLLYTPTPLTDVPPVSSDHQGVRLPKIDIPTFNGNILNWQTF